MTGTVGQSAVVQHGVGVLDSASVVVHGDRQQVDQALRVLPA
jgi:hypothetical protein